MGKIDEACKEVVERVDGAAACGLVDLDTGKLLGVHNASQHLQPLTETVATAVKDLFGGPNFRHIQQMVRSHRGVSGDAEPHSHEAHITSAGNFHFMKTIKGGQAVLVLVTRKTTNIGMGWAMLKAVIPTVEPLVP